MKNKKNKKKAPVKTTEAVSDLYSPDADPQGSYTGKCEEPYEKPVQDADDL